MTLADRITRQIAGALRARSEHGQDAEQGERIAVLIAELLRRFGPAVRALQARGHGRPSFEITDEYDVQDLVHMILRLHAEDVRPEEVTPSYAGSSSRMDFLLKREHVAVEVKMARANLRSPEQSRHLRVFDPEGRGTASSDWARFDQKRPGIQVLGQARQPAALRSEQQLEQRCKSRA